MAKAKEKKLIAALWRDLKSDKRKEITDHEKEQLREAVDRVVGRLRRETGMHE